MRKIYIIVFLILALQASAQEAFNQGEWFRFKISYSGFLKAGEATLAVEDASYKGISSYHIKGFGETTGLARLFFKVDDKYETIIDKQTILPYKFIRNIDEGGHTKDKSIDFDQKAHIATVSDNKHNKVSKHSTEPSVHDMISSFYYLRNTIDETTIQPGDETVLNMFFDEKNFKFKLKFLGKEVLRTKFGKVRALRFRPYVQAGRVFKEKESLTIWVSDDKNKIPLRIKADLAVGSLKADLDAYKGLKNQFLIIQD